MKNLVSTIVCLIVLLSVSLAEANEQERGSVPTPCRDRGFECTLIAGVGVNTGAMSHATFYGAFRLSYLERVPFALEVNFALPYGIGANLLFCLYRGERINIHIIDIGIFYSWYSDMSATWLPREYDLSAGCGIELLVSRGLAVTLDWRAFFADPFNKVPNYADFGLMAYGESARGGEL